MKALRCWCYDDNGQHFEYVSVGDAETLEAEIKLLHELRTNDTRYCESRVAICLGSTRTEQKGKSFGLLMNEVEDKIERLEAESLTLHHAGCAESERADGLQAEVGRLQTEAHRLADALSFYTVLIDPRQSEETDDWGLTDIRWREKLAGMLRKGSDPATIETKESE